MRFVAVKDEAQQANGVVLRALDGLVRQRTQGNNALRGHLTEYGYVVANGATYVPTLIDQVEDPNCHLPASARTIFKVLIATLTSLDENIAALDAEIDGRAKDDPVGRRLTTIPGVGPITATAIVALALQVETFRSGRHFAARLGLTPLQKSTGGKQRLGSNQTFVRRNLVATV